MIKLPSNAGIAIFAGIATALILVLVGANGWRYMKDRQADKARQECVERLKILDSAIQQWALEKGKDDNESPEMYDLVEFIAGGIPQCPVGGTYRLGLVSGHPACSVTGHEIP